MFDVSLGTVQNAAFRDARRDAGAGSSLLRVDAHHAKVLGHGATAFLMTILGSSIS